MSAPDSIKKIVPDSDHGFWWSICRWQFFIVSFFLSAGLATLVYLGDGWGWEFSFGYLFFINLATAASRFVFTITFPVLIRCFVKHQIGKYVSFFVAIVSMILGSVLVRFVFDGQPIFYESITTIFYTVAAYKIMRSVAGISSVFWGGKKENQAEENKFSELSGQNVRGEVRSQVIANSGTLLQEAIRPNASNDTNEENGFTETPTTDKAAKPHVVEAPKNTMAKINLVLLLVLISWVSVFSYYCWDGLNRAEKRDSKIIKKLDDAERKIMEQMDRKLDARIGMLMNSSGVSVRLITNQDEFEEAVDRWHALPDGKERNAYESAVIQYHEISMSRGEDPWIPRKKKRFEKNCDKATYSALDLSDPAIEAEARDVIGEEEVKYLKDMDESMRKDFAVGRAAATMFGDDSYGSRAMLGEKLGVPSDTDTIFGVLKEMGDKRREERSGRK